jgi:CubicO group peptidase (beta-lactamase class C family)
MNLVTGQIHPTPRSLDFDGDKINLLDSFHLRNINQDRIQCAGYLIARNNRIIAHKTMGSLRYDDPDSQFRPDSLRCIASLTKIFTALAVLKLQEQGRLALDDPAASFIEEFNVPYYNDITIFHLVTPYGGITARARIFR